MSDRKSVQVAVRVRPLVATEVTKGCKDILEIHPDINQVRIRNTEKAFTYNHVFGPDISQDEFYNTAVKSLIASLFEGYNLTILAYGQTGSGKTHSMGTNYTGDGDMGVIPKAIQEIFDFVRNNFVYDFTITVSFMELYQEVLYDLLAKKPREQCVLDIREDANKGIVIPGLSELAVQNSQDVYEALMRGSLGRATGSTNMNAQSSRSHAIFTVNFCLQNKNDSNEIKTAKLHLVDLAGSERSKKTGAVGTTFKEGVNINKGLLALGNVISILGEDRQSSFIPYRDSNLTRLLKDSLGGNSITLMLACVSPADYNLDETLSTLRYADRARKIQNKPIVNQDAHVGEINALKKTIQQLRLQIVGQGGPVTCPAEIELLKKENTDLRVKIRDLTLQLSGTLNNNTDLIEKVMILQNANEVLNKKINELKDEYDITLNNISVGLDQNDVESIKTSIDKLRQIHSQFLEIDSEQKRTEQAIQKHEHSMNNLYSSQNNLVHTEMSQDQESHTNKQMALNMEIQEVTKKLAMKEYLAKQIATNAQYMVDYNALAENEAKILNLQKEKDELLRQLKNMRSDGGSSGKAAQQRKRVQELEGQIHDLNRKVQEQARMIKLKEKDESKIRQLNGEILQMKQHRVKLIRSQKEETERFKVWKQQRERELAKLKQQDRKKQNQIVKMEVMHSKQQNVLKRKVEEAVALNKRLKDALALRKAAQETKNTGKIDRIGVWLKHEVEVYGHIVEAKATLKGLLDDRGTLQEQLDKLKESEEENAPEIKAIEEDIELRSVQIQDLQQKLLDSDEDNKARVRFDNLQTMSEAKFALKMLFDQFGEIKKKEVLARSKAIESQANHNEFEAQITALEAELEEERHRHNEDLGKLQAEHTEKVSVLLRQLRGVQVQAVDEELKQRCQIQQEKIDEMESRQHGYEMKILQLSAQNDILKDKLNTVTRLAQSSQTPLKERMTNGSNASNGDTDHTPMGPPPKVRVIAGASSDNRLTQSSQSPLKEHVVNGSNSSNGDTDHTPIMGPPPKVRVIGSPLSDNENIDTDVEEEGDNIEKDPDWRKTPIGKWLMDRRRRNTSNRSTLDVTDKRPAFKRTSDGGCMCIKSNCSKRCGCRKISKSCGPACKCSHSLCTNRLNNSDEASPDLFHDDSSKRPRGSYEDTDIVPQKLLF